MRSGRFLGVALEKFPKLQVSHCKQKRALHSSAPINIVSYRAVALNVRSRGCNGIVAGNGSEWTHVNVRKVCHKNRKTPSSDINMGRQTKRIKKKKSPATAAKPAAAKNTQKYSIDDLLDKTEEYIDRFEFSLAQKFCERALEMDGDNVRALETSASLLLELGNMDAAKQCYGRAIEVQPDEGHEKYMCMGQLMTGEHAVNCFQKGIDIMKKKLAESEAAASASNPDISLRDIARAYCNIAEIYLTDECFDDDAEAKCKQNLENALGTDPDYPECHHLFASFWISKEELDKAKESIEKGVSMWLPAWKENVKNDDADIVEVCPIGYPERINATKILIELKDYELSGEILEMLLDEDDSIVETWYLLGWSNYLQGEDYYTNARFYLQKAQKVAKQTQCEDENLVQHITELVQELGPGDDKEEEEEGDDNVEMSDIDSDEEENGESMEH